MPMIPGVRRLFRFPWRTRRSVEADFDDEVRLHLELRERELQERHGMDPSSARAEALRQFGDIDATRRYVSQTDVRVERAARRRLGLEGMRQDLLRALRGLRRGPGFAAVVILSLAFGIGSVTAAFALVDALMLRPLPVPQPERLIGFGDPGASGRTDTGPPGTALFSYPLYLALRDGSQVVPGLAASGYSSRFEVTVPAGQGAPAPTDGSGEAEPWRGRLVSGNFFAVLGVRAAAGRLLTADDDRAPGASPVAVISHAYWERRFELDPSIVGRTIVVNETPVTVVGVAAEGFAGEVAGNSTGLWMPLTLQPLLLPNQRWLDDWHTSWLLLLGRGREGATPAAAGEELTALARNAVAAGTDAAPTAVSRLTVQGYGAPRGFSGAPREFRVALATLLGLAALLLLVVCANVANLLVARTAGRRTELGVRLALGGSRWRVVRMLMTESVVLGTVAGALALVVLLAASELMVRRLGMLPAASVLDIARGPRVLAFAAILSLAAACSLGLVPALRATHEGVASALRSGSAGIHGDPLLGSGRRFGLGKWLVVGQIAVSLVLLSAAGLFYRTATHLARTDIGAARDEVVMMKVDAHSLPAGEGRRLAQERVAARLAALPGVRAVSYSQNGLFSGIETGTSVHVPGFDAQAPGDTLVLADRVGADYFAAVGARILLGRGIDAGDGSRAAPVAVVNESMARFFFADGGALGRGFEVDGTGYQVVGVVADIRHQNLRSPPDRRYYVPIAHGEAPGLVVFALRVHGDPAEVATAAAREVRAMEPRMRVRDARPLASLVRESIVPEILVASLAAAAGVLALGLAALGLYGVIAQMVARRRSEFGLRLALGAGPGDVTRMVLRQSLGLFLLGSAVGLPLAVGVARVVRSQLVGVAIFDPRTLALALGVLAATAALAAYRPARRAAGVPPQDALRHE